MEEILIVDGYNLIGAARQVLGMETTELEDARHELIEQLAEYQAFKGIKVYLIFDAHLQPGVGQTVQFRQLEVVYTKENQTADEYIEKLVRLLKRVDRQIYVATSDYVEQQVIFGGGALRKPARELLTELRSVNEDIDDKVQEKYSKKNRHGQVPLDKEMAKIFEKWRRSR